MSATNLAILPTAQLPSATALEPVRSRAMLVGMGSCIQPTITEPVTGVDYDENDYFFPIDDDIDDGSCDQENIDDNHHQDDSTFAQATTISSTEKCREVCNIPEPVIPSLPYSSEYDKDRNIEQAVSCLHSFFFGANENLVSIPRDEVAPTPPISPTTSNPHQFSLLQSSDRANSMPPDYYNYRTSGLSQRPDGPTLKRKSSMKKISSIGNFSSSQSFSGRSGSGDLMKREVSFSNLEIRQYEVALSDHPSCSYGPPVQLSWQYQPDEVVVPVESYEQSRSPRREKEQLVLSYNERRHMLLKQAGYSKKDVKKAMKEVQRVKNERLVTDLLLPASALDEAVETSVDYIKQFFIPPEDRCYQPSKSGIGRSRSPPLSLFGFVKSPTSVMSNPNDIVLERKRENNS